MRTMHGARANEELGRGVHRFNAVHSQSLSAPRMLVRGHDSPMTLDKMRLRISSNHLRK